MKNALRNPTALRREIADLRHEVATLIDARDRLLRNIAVAEEKAAGYRRPASEPPGADVDESVYVLDDDAAEARAFDDFYRAYDDGHAKTRKFLLG
ncbi:MAG: hypothetical protein ACR2QO_15155 [Acidimicrobiales bacterium]